jgi:hypothetical protein
MRWPLTAATCIPARADHASEDGEQVGGRSTAYRAPCLPGDLHRHYPVLKSHLDECSVRVRETLHWRLRRRGSAEGLIMVEVHGSTGENHDQTVPAGPAEYDLHDRERRAADQDAALNVREADLVAAEAVLAARNERTQQILSRGTQRDGDADQRDLMADRRDMSANLDSFLSRDAPNRHDGGSDRQARNFAAHDREDSKGDRAAAARDRSQLAQDASAELGEG